MFVLDKTKHTAFSQSVLCLEHSCKFCVYAWRILAARMLLATAEVLSDALRFGWLWSAEPEDILDLRG